MKAFIWWVRSAFCKHEWQTVMVADVEKAWPPSMVGQPTGIITIKECTKCGRRRTQRNGL